MRRSIPIIAGLCLVLGCRSEGSVSLRFTIEDLPTDLTGLFLHAQIRDADGDVLSGSVTPAARDARFALSVPHGDERIAVVELRDSASETTSNVIAYGVSAPFALEVGANDVVEAVVTMRRVPSIITLTAPAVTRESNVTIRVGADREDLAELVLAQDPSLTFGRQVFDAAAGLSVVYDVDAACRAANSCADGRRNVFARVVDRAGYSSTATSTPIFVDTQPPKVLPGSGSVQFIAPGELRPIDAAGAGVTVRLSFVLDEPITSTPTVTLANSGLAFDLVNTELGAYIYERVITAEDPIGRQRPSVRARDNAGNEAPGLAADLEYVVRHDGPTPVTVDVADAVVYHRDPFRHTSQGGASFSVVGAPGAVDPGARVVVYDRADAFVDGVEVANRAGAADAEEDGSFVVPLAPVDLPEVFVLAIDAAGNFDRGGRATRVRDVAWRVPAGVDEGAEPPVDVFTLDRLPDTARLDAAGVEAVFDKSALAIADGIGIESHFDPRWTEFVPASSPLPDELRFAAVAEDPARGRVVVHGGRSSGDLQRRETWEWDGKTWRSFGATGAQPECDDGSAAGDDPFGAMVFDGSLGRALLVCRQLVPRQAPPLPAGGTDVLRAFTWDGERWRSAAIDASASPGGRSGSALAYDATRGRTVMFGGNRSSLVFAGGSATTLDDTWELMTVPSSSVGQPAHLAWIEATPSGPTPPARDRHAMVHAPGLGVVMFGGVSAAADRHTLDDLWIWDGTAWTEIPKSGAWPPARALHTMVYDSRTGAVGVLGGVATEPVSDRLDQLPDGFADAWWWDGATWTETPSAPEIPHGAGIAAASLRARGDVYALTAVDAFERPSSKTFSVSPEHWIDRTPSSAVPPQTPTHDLMYDPGRDRFWLQTSRGPFPNAVSETWYWSDNGWQFSRRDPSVGQARGGVFDVRRDEVFIRASIAPEPGEPTLPISLRFFVGDGGGWTPTSSTSIGRPLSVFGSFSAFEFDEVLLYDRRRDRPVLVAWGGYDEVNGVFTGFELYEWSNPTWRSIAFDPLVATRSSPLVVYDDRTGHYIVQTTDIGAISQTFVYDGNGWAERPGTAAAWSVHRGVVSDAARHRVLTVGSTDGRARVWSWDGASYREQTTRGSPPTRFVHRAIAYDDRRHRVAVVESPIYLVSPLQAPAGAVYLLDVDPDAAPAVSIRARLAAGGVAPGLVQSVRIESDAGGVGFAATSSVATTGAVLSAFDRTASRWVPLAMHAAADDAPAPLVHELTREEITRLLDATDASLRVAIHSRAGLGAGESPARVNVDRLDVVVTYRLP